MKAAHIGIGEFRREVVLDDHCGQVCELLDRGPAGEKLARLLAAAPEMLMACRNAIGVIGLPLHPNDAVAIQAELSAAIAKAEGK